MNLQRRVASIETAVGRPDKDPNDMSLAEITHELALLSTPAGLEDCIEAWAVEMAASCVAKLDEDGKKYPWLASISTGHLGAHGRGCHCDDVISQSRANIEAEWARLGLHGRSLAK